MMASFGVLRWISCILYIGNTRNCLVYMYWKFIYTSWEYGINDNYATITYVEESKYHDEIKLSIIFMWDILTKKYLCNIFMHMMIGINHTPIRIGHVESIEIV